MLYINSNIIPAKLVNLIRKLAAFQNPEFYKAQAMRMSIFGKPRIIHCDELFESYLAVPRGCKGVLEQLLDTYNVKIQYVDKRASGNNLAIDFIGELYAEQEQAVKALLKHDIGVLSARTGFGKTVVAARIIAERKVSTLILVHRQQLLEQWQERLQTFLNLDKSQIGVVKSGKFKLGQLIDIAMMQSLIKRGKVSDILANYGQVIVDECHHVSAFSFEEILKHAKAKYVLGLTATPFRKDGHHPIIFMQCGPVRFQTAQKSCMHDLPFKVKVNHTSFLGKADNISTLYQMLVEDETRNKLILTDLINAYNRGECPLLLTERKQHLEWFSNALKAHNINDVFLLQGGMKKAQQKMTFEKLKTLDDNRIILATGRFIGEGFDDPRLDALFLALPISWHGTLQQYVGRLHRNLSNKSKVVVYDYVDSNSPVLLRMYQKRLKKYQTMGYEIESL